MPKHSKPKRNSSKSKRLVVRVKLPALRKEDLKRIQKELNTLNSYERKLLPTYLEMSSAERRRQLEFLKNLQRDLGAQYELLRQELPEKRIAKSQHGSALLGKLSKVVQAISALGFAEEIAQAKKAEK